MTRQSLEKKKVGHSGGNGHEEHKGHQGHHKGDHHAHMVSDFRKRFWISLSLTLPVLALSPMIQSFLGVEKAVSFSGDSYVLWAFSTALFLYGGRPFLKGLYDELRKKEPGMMTLKGA